MSKLKSLRSHTVVHLVIQCIACYSPPQGSSPAGGCLMSITCDYRIMADNPRYSIGLNETQLGIVAPFWLAKKMATLPTFVVRS